ncbi:LacI family DNA-binding transcriptional regulator [Novosphingobium sp. FKTRR1]|uniref:LacI family DNA-binding transcriptional regulator n=1 Tax=Novosphingobium sp. FKTRR1 TaxID=2879118 RepID=UPI001CF00448|nr:LacI family DNA-binding transcriptional regulator [Novosphingobium sp. FKTRR1]
MTTTPRKPRSGKRGPTVADVARCAGVSPMTVSRVINSEPNVMPATREKVEAAIVALGYVPNPAARSLAGGQQCRIALLHANPSAAYLSEFLMGSLAQASKLDVQLIVEDCDLLADPAELVRRLIDHRVDAVLLPPPLCDDEVLLKALHLAGLPIAQIATGRPAEFAYAVTIDDEAAAHAMTGRLIGLGHRRIGFVAGATNQTASALRFAGYARALSEAGLTPDDRLVREGDFTYRSGLVAAEALLALPEPPTAIFASNDDMAAAAVAVAHRHRLEVPRDLSVCGFDNSAMATTIWPEITTIDQPVAEMARRATALLAEAVRGRAGPPAFVARHIQLAFKMLPRASDACAPPCAQNHGLGT